ncbi:MAG: hypothetical protein JWR00_106 [Rubritepida sp.]|nr:hypothetical protein [Rubritepida sp.]
MLCLALQASGDEVSLRAEADKPHTAFIRRHEGG